MKGGIKMSRKEIFRVLIVILFLFNFFIMYSCNKSSDENTKSIIKKNIHVVFYMDPATVEHKGAEKIPVFIFDPRDAMKKSLKEAGFRYEEFLIISKGSSTSSQSLEAYNQKIKNGDYRPYDLKLVVTYVERARARSPYPEVPKRVAAEINTVGFSVGLYDDKDNRLLDEEFDRSMLIPVAANIDVRVRFCEAIPQLILDRLEAEDEVTYLLSRIQKEEYPKILERGGGASLIRQLGQLRDPRAINVMLPFLRIGNRYVRWLAKYALFSLGYTPQSVKEKAAWDVIDFEEPLGFNAEKSETIPWGIRERSSGPDGLVWHRMPLPEEHFILYYGLDGIELLLEDLQTERGSQEYDIANAAVGALFLLSQEEWKYAWGEGYVDIDDFFFLEKITSMTTEEINRKLTSKIIKPPSRQKGRRTIERRHFASLFRQEWNAYATDSLVAALNDVRSKDKYLRDVIYILGVIGNRKVIDALKPFLSDPSQSANVKEAIHRIESRGKS
jgi:hypothetical protein